jgi:hypothetical protein
MTVLFRPKEGIGVEWGDARAGTRYSLQLIQGDINLRATSGEPPATMRPGWDQVGASLEWYFHRAAIDAHCDRHWIRKVDASKHYERFGHVLYVSVSLIYLVLAALLLPVMFLVTRARRMRRRPSPTACPACGYDCRATPTRCPECGRELNGA